MASEPIRLLKSGAVADAEQAFEEAAVYARNLPPTDYRRGAMLGDLTTYLRARKRHADTLRYYDEALGLLGNLQEKAPEYYIATLNNYAVYLISCNRLDACRVALEKMSDVLLVAKKPKMARWFGCPWFGFPIEGCDIFLRTNTAALFRKTGDYAQARLQLRMARDQLTSLQPKHRQLCADQISIETCKLAFAMGRAGEAEAELAAVADPESESFLYARAMICLARHEYKEAERLIRLALAAPDLLGESHRPEALNLWLNLAESLFCQAQYDESFRALAEARSIVVDFEMAAVNDWRNALANWQQRAQNLGRLELAANLEQELSKGSATPNQAITASDKLRIQPHSMRITSQPPAGG
ncbi:MAG TPA: tetratricopeptide repeat protein [Gemmataceae bacterium]|nr:tetratricopeptide repeat protein [Gemmataceae bacterium]